MREIRASTVDMRQTLEEELADGVEARSFVRIYGPFLAAADEHVALVRELIESLSLAEDVASQNFLASLRLLEQENRAFRDLLAKALAQASDPGSQLITSSSSKRSAMLRVCGTTTSIVGTKGQLPRTEITPREGV